MTDYRHVSLNKAGESHICDTLSKFGLKWDHCATFLEIEEKAGNDGADFVESYGYSYETGTRHYSGHMRFIDLSPDHFHFENVPN